ncbi:hypothetical protein JTE90_013083 [Oedothorax gibbosus]|uniref:VWFC domain-containing protein n=1 Tax=Oedothorax gibbosus TaxID=931172 RepID=A0AAV6UKM6_9ARAC|nr:hypothetical protein JTE90_013083 [Oedothorax gibbosus]
MFSDRGTMPLLVLLFLVVCFASWTPTEGRVIRKRAAFYIANETMCIVDGDVFLNGDPVPTDDECEKCTCRPPGFSCVLRDCDTKPGCKAVRRAGECCPEYVCGCIHNNRVYEDGEVIRDLQNACYTCRCHGSSISCTFADCLFRGDCPPEYVQGECCPRYDHCPPIKTTSTTPISTIFTTQSTTTTTTARTSPIVQQEEHFINLTTQHLEKFTDADTTVHIEDIQHGITSIFTTSSYFTTTPDESVTVKFTLTEGRITSIHDYDFTTLSSILPLQTGTYTETTRYAVPDDTHGGLTTTTSVPPVASDVSTTTQHTDSDLTTTTHQTSVEGDLSTTTQHPPADDDVLTTTQQHITESRPSTTTQQSSTEYGLLTSTHQSAGEELLSKTTTQPFAEGGPSTTIHQSLVEDSSLTTIHAEKSLSTTTQQSTTEDLEPLPTSTQQHDTDHTTAQTDVDIFTHSSTIDRHASSSAIEDMSLESSTADISGTSQSPESTTESIVDGVYQSNKTTETVYEDYETSSFNDLDTSTQSSHDSTSHYITGDPSEITSTNYETPYTGSADVFHEISINDTNVALSSSTSAVSESSTTYKTTSVASKVTSESSTLDYDAIKFTTPSVPSEDNDKITDAHLSTSTIVFAEISSVDEEESISNTLDAFSESDFSGHDDIAPSSDPTSFESTTSKDYPDSSTVDQDVSNTVSERSTTEEKTFSFSTDSFEGSTTGYDFGATLTSKTQSEDFVVDQESSSASSSEFFSEKDEHSFKTTALPLEKSSFSEAADLQTEESFNVHDLSAKYTTLKPEGTNSEMDSSAEDSGSATTHKTEILTDNIEISTLLTGDGLKTSTVTVFSDDYSGGSDFVDSQTRVTDNGYDVKEFSISINAPTETINVTETHYPSSTHFNFEETISPEHIAEISSISTIETFSNEKEIPTGKPTDLLELTPSTEKPLHESSTEDETINAESDKTSNVPDSIITSSTAGESSSSNENDVHFESSTYTKEQYFSGTHEETVNAEQTEQTSEILDEDMKGTSISSVGTESFTYNDPQTKEQSSFSKSVETTTDASSTFTTTSVRHNESSHLTTIESNVVIESETTTHTPLQMNELSTHDSENDRTVTTFESQTENSLKYSTESQTNNVQNELLGISDPSETLGSKIPDKESTNEQSSSVITVNSGAALITNKTEVDELDFDINESEMQKHLNASSHLEESGSGETNGTDNNALDIQYSSLPEQYISTTSTLEKVIEESTTHFNEYHAINGQNEHDLSKIDKPDEKHDLNEHTTSSDKLSEVTSTDTSIRTVKPTILHDLTTGYPTGPTEEELKHNVTAFQAVSDLVTTESAESLNNADNSLSRNPFISHTSSPNYLEESIVTEGFEDKNNEEYYKISTTKFPIDETEYTAEKTTESPPDPETLQTKSSMTISTDINDKTNTDLVTLHPLKTDLSGLLSVNNKPLQTTELPKPTKEANEHSTGKVKDGTTISYNKQTEYASSEASTSVLDENESHIVLTNLEVEISSNPTPSDNQEESIKTEDFSEHVTTEESNISMENAHNLSLPQITSGIPGEGLFTKQNQKFNESTSYPNYVEEFPETELNENNHNATDSDAKINGPNVSTEYSIAYDIADAEEITVLDPLPNNSAQEQNIPTENSKNVLNETSTEFEGLITESNSIPQETNTNSIIYDELLLNNEQDSEHLTPPQANETNFSNDVDLLVSTNSSLNTTHSEFDDYSVLDAEDDVNDTFVSQEVHSGSDKTALSVESNGTSEKIPYLNVPIENFQLEGNEDGTKIKNVSAILSSASAELPEEENESVVTEPNIVSSPDVYHTEAISLGEDVRTTVISDNTTLELELDENLKTNSPKEENMEKSTNTHESDISTSSSYPSEYEINKSSFISTASSEGEITSSSDIYESTHFSTLQPSHSTEFVSTTLFPDDVKVSSDKQQFNGSTTVSDLGEDIEITSDVEHGYSSTMISTIKEHEKENQHTQFYKPATEESVSQTETVFVSESTADTDAGKSTPFEPENYVLENSAPVVEDNAELITYNNHRGNEQELTSVQPGETTTRNQVNILFGQITDRFSTIYKPQLDSVTSVTDLIQPQTEGDELAESHITIDENNFGVALHEIGDAPTIKPDVVESISEVTTTKQPEIHDHIDDLYENEYDSEEDTHELIENSHPTVKSSSTSYEQGNSSDIDTVEDNTTPSKDNFSVLGYLGNLFSSSTTSDSTDVVSTESANSSQEHPLEIGESAEHLDIDAVASSESNYGQFTTVNLSSNTTEKNFNSGSTNGEYSDINNTVETDLLTESNSNALPIHENSTYVNQDNSQTTEKASENTENSNTKVDVSPEEEDLKAKIVQNNSPEQNYSNDQTTSTKFEPNLIQKDYVNNESTTSNTSPPNFNGTEVSTIVAENSKHDQEFNSATTLALYVFNRGNNNDTAANSSEEMATIDSDINRNPDILYDTHELQSTHTIPIESTEYISSVQDPTNSQKDINDPKSESSHKNRDNVNTSLGNPTYSELPEKHENRFTSQGIVNDIRKPFQPYSLYDVISNVFKAPGYDVEVQEQAGVANKQNPAGVVKRDTNQRGERQISTIYEAAISDAKNLQPLPRRLQEKTVPSRGFGFSRNLRQNLPQSQPNPQPQQQDPEQPAFASVTSSFIIVDRADEGFRSRRKIPIRNPDGEIQEIEVPADFDFSPPSFRRFPSKSVTENEKNH